MVGATARQMAGGPGFGLAGATNTVGAPFFAHFAKGVSAEGDKRKAVFIAQMPAGSLSFDPAGHDQLNFDFVVSPETTSPAK